MVRRIAVTALDNYEQRVMSMRKEKQLHNGTRQMIYEIQARTIAIHME